MNLKLMPNDVEVDFRFIPPEIHKSNEDIKSIAFNSEGTVVIIITKSNEIRLFDFLGRTILFTIPYFALKNLKITGASWYPDSSSIYITYENNKEYSGYQKVNLNFKGSPQPPYYIDDTNTTDISTKLEVPYLHIKDARIFQKRQNLTMLYLSGINPAVIDLTTNNITYFLSQDNISVNKNIIIVKEAAFNDSYYLIVKELYLIFYIKPQLDSNITNNNANPNNNVNPKSFNKNKLSYEQSLYVNYFIAYLNKRFICYDILSLLINGEISHVQLNDIQTLMLINSTDRVLRLYCIVDETLTHQKDYSDSVNKKRWVAGYFYTKNIKKGYQDLIVTSLCDSNSLEFTFIEIENGKMKKLEPFKYSVQDFVCHSKNHFSLLVVSGKKLFLISGIIINQWGCFAPGLKYIEENIEFVEDEGFYDGFEEKMKENIKKETYNEDKIEECFVSSNSNSNNKTKNLFFKYEPGDDAEKEKSMNELKELFNYVNQQIES